MSRSQDESEALGSRAQRRPQVPRFSFDDVDENRFKILQQNSRKYEPRKPSIALCVALGLFLLPGLILYLVGLLVYNKWSEYKFNKQQSTDLSEAERAKNQTLQSHVDRTETEDSTLSQSRSSYSRSHRSLSQKSRRGSTTRSHESSEEGVPLSSKKKSRTTSSARASVDSSSSSEDSTADTESPPKSHRSSSRG